MDYLSRLEHVEAAAMYWEVADADREAAPSAECPACGHIGLDYCLDREAQAYYRCPMCGCRDYI